MAGRYSGDKPYVSNVNVKVRSQTREKRKQIGHTEQIGATFFFFLECNAKSNLLYIIFSAPACRKPITMVRYPYLPFRVPGRIMWRTFLGTMSSGPLYSWKTPLFCAALWSLFKGNCPCLASPELCRARSNRFVPFSKPSDISGALWTQNLRPKFRHSSARALRRPSCCKLH